MSLVIRNACLKDTQAIYLLNLNGLGYDYPMEHTEKRLAQVIGSDALLLVAELDGIVAGYIHAVDYDCSYSDSLKNILAFVVDERFRRNGIGRSLIAAVEEWAKETGASGIRLTSGMSRENAHKFYESCGYVNRKIAKQFVKMFTGGAN